ncbi:hypothetical protein ACQE98_13465 [Ornithinimicrobium sp. W1679]|uniref:hypothetical protein n=1 Tax=Ornithinimicrobium sp. W1679 TaxID=3418770 RepID=UPI003CEC646F
MNRPRRTLPAAAALVLVLAGCGAEQGTPSEADPTATDTPAGADAGDGSSTDSATVTGPEDAAGTDGAGTGTDGTGDDGGSSAPTSTDGTADDTSSGEDPSTSDGGTDPAYPSDPSAYADALVAAWAAGDTDRVADLAVEEVELATGTWSTDTEWQLERTDDLNPFGDVGQGRWAVYYSHRTQGASMTVTVDGDDLGDGEAVVGVDYYLIAGSADAFDRLGSPVNDYVDTFHQAMIDHDEAVVERLGTQRATDEALAHDPAVAGRLVTDHGFLAFEDEPLHMLFSFPDHQDPSDFTRMLDLDARTAAEGGDDGVLRLNVLTDWRWS